MVISILRMILIMSVLFGLACTHDRFYVSGADIKPVESSNSEAGRQNFLVNNEKWQMRQVENYDFDLSASGYLRPFDPMVRISVRNGKVASIKNPTGGLVKNADIYDKFSTFDAMFEFLNMVSMRNPERLVVTYNAEHGFPSYIDLDEKEQMADDELTLKITNFVASNGE
jgi:hypothetical protein